MVINDSKLYVFMNTYKLMEIQIQLAFYMFIFGFQIGCYKEIFNLTENLPP